MEISGKALRVFGLFVPMRWPLVAATAAILLATLLGTSEAQAGTFALRGQAAVFAAAVCACPVGPYVDPAAVDVALNPDGTSPNGVYKATSTGGGGNPINLTITNVATGATVLSLSGLPSNTLWGFSPNDDGFVYHYLTSGSSMENVFLHNLAAANPSLPVWKIQATIASSRISFTPHGRYLAYVHVDGAQHTTMNVVDTVAGAPLAYNTTFHFISPPGGGGGTFGVVGWGFSSEPADGTFVYSYVNGPSTVEWYLVNLAANHSANTPGKAIRHETISGASAFWQLSPCGDVIALAVQPVITSLMVNVTLIKTGDGSVVKSTSFTPSSTLTFHSKLASATTVSHFATVDGVDNLLAIIRPPSTPGPCWTMQPTPNPAGATSSQLGGVSCAAATACTAVGYGSYGVLAELWNGTGWAIQSTPNPSGATYSQLIGVSCTAATACTAVGYYTNSGGTDASLAELWNGSSWTVQPTPIPSGATGSYLLGVSCKSTTTCIAVGFYINSSFRRVTLAEIWNGTSWAIQSTPNPSGATYSQLRGVSCPAATACKAVGDYINSSGTDVTLAERWNGTSWAIQRTSIPLGALASYLRGVSCTAATACTAVGVYVINSSTDVTLAERWNGTSWAIQSTPNPAGATNSLLYGVSCTTATACTAVGWYSNSSSAALTLGERWRGSSWAIQSTPNPAGATLNVLNGVSCTAATACTAVGSDSNSSGTDVTLAERYS